MTESKSGGISMLDKLAGNIVETKTAASAKLSPGLTPVAGEVTAGLPRTPAVFPYDFPNDVLNATIADLERQVVNLTGIITALKLLGGMPEVVAAEIAKDKATTKRLVEREADRRAVDAERAATGDKKAAERVNAAQPLEEVALAAEVRDAKRAAVLAAMMDGPTEPPVAPLSPKSGSSEPLVSPAQQPSVGTEPFPDRLARLADEAKAATFKPDGWTCPQHGDTMIAVKVSPRRGVQFRRCAVVDCHEFEKV
jgi:hypothetical protein